MLIHNNFRSWCLKSNVDVDIIIPDLPQKVEVSSFYNRDIRFKVLWLLHGTYGGYTDFVRRTNIDLYAKECNLMVVMVDALNTDYMNWPNFNLGFNMYDYLIKELMPLIHNWFPASDKKEDNFIAGVSMGGLGAYKYAVNYPDHFAGCSCMSCAPQNVRKLAAENKLVARELNDIANMGGLDKYLDSYENTWDLTNKIKDNQNCPKFYFSIGTEDFLLDRYNAFKEYCIEIGFDNITFDEQPGYGHEWRLWELELQKSLDFFGLHGTRNITKETDMSMPNGNLL